MGNASQKCIEIGPNEYEIHRTMGQGAFGRVVCIIDKKHDHMLAMKVLEKCKILEKGEGCVRSMIRERKILSDLSFPFIVNLHCSLQSDMECYLVLDFASGGDLYFHIHNRKRISEDVIRFWMCGVMLGLEYLHKQGVLHRDVKPDNIMLNSKGYPLLTDFNVAGRMKDGQCCGFCGTDAYIAPEMYLKDEEKVFYGPEVDIWSLGIVIYECFAKESPWGPRGKQSTKTWMGHCKTTQTLDGCLEKSTIKTKNIKYSSRIPENVVSLLKQVLVKRTRRIDMDTLKSQSWWAPLNFEEMEKGTIVPPFIPEFRANVDTQLAMDDQFKAKTKRRVPTSEEQQLFLEWDFIPQRYVFTSSAATPRKKKKSRSHIIASSNAPSRGSGDSPTGSGTNM